MGLKKQGGGEGGAENAGLYAGSNLRIFFSYDDQGLIMKTFMNQIVLSSWKSIGLYYIYSAQLRSSNQRYQCAPNDSLRGVKQALGGEGWVGWGAENAGLYAGI